MTNRNANLRKAAVLIRSLDADAAATLLAQLSPDEAARVRQAIRTVGQIDSDEQADVLAEFRRIRPMASNSASGGVELSLSQPHIDAPSSVVEERPPAGRREKRFDFLDNAPTAVLVRHLSREHAQTVAVVLAHLAPAHAAKVLSALPQKLQADAVERLNVLGETDSQAVAVLESELAAWFAQRSGGAAERGRRGDAVAAILAAADEKSHAAIVGNLKSRNIAVPDHNSRTRTREHLATSSRQPERDTPRRTQRLVEQPSVRHDAPSRPSLPHLEFDHLIHLDDETLATVLRSVDANTLALALAGSADAFVDRICNQMPKRVAKTFRRELRRLGPTRLSDVEAAQRVVAQVAAKQLAQRRMNANSH